MWTEAERQTKRQELEATAKAAGVSVATAAVAKQAATEAFNKENLKVSLLESLTEAIHTQENQTTGYEPKHYASTTVVSDGFGSTHYGGASSSSGRGLAASGDSGGGGATSGANSS